MKTCKSLLKIFIDKEISSEPVDKNLLSTIQYYEPNERPYGLSFGEWTVKWWRWVVSIPIKYNPVFDNTGVCAGINQLGPVWYLVGTFGENKVRIRSCTIPFGKCLFFPVINYEINQLEDPTLKTDDAMINHVLEDIDDIVNKTVLVDGELIPTFRIQSSPTVFNLDIGTDNCLGIKPGTIRSAADGYWVFLKPLNVGKHDIYFHGSCSGGIRNCTAKYNLNII